jgi:hypothetical protein
LLENENSLPSDTLTQTDEEEAMVPKNKDGVVESTTIIAANNPIKSCPPNKQDNPPDNENSLPATSSDTLTQTDEEEDVDKKTLRVLFNPIKKPQHL